MTEKLIGEIFSTRGQGTQVGIKKHRLGWAQGSIVLGGVHTCATW